MLLSVELDHHAELVRHAPVLVVYQAVEPALGVDARGDVLSKGRLVFPVGHGLAACDFPFPFLDLGGEHFSLFRKFSVVEHERHHHAFCVCCLCGFGGLLLE